MKKGDIPNKGDCQIQLQQTGRTKLVCQCKNANHLKSQSPCAVCSDRDLVIFRHYGNVIKIKN